jgi:hypothetical protein
MINEINVLSWMNEEDTSSCFTKLAEMMGIPVRHFFLDTDRATIGFLIEHVLKDSSCLAISHNTLEKIIYVNRFNKDFKTTLFNKVAFLLVFGFSGHPIEGQTLEYLTEGILKGTIPEHDMRAKYEVNPETKVFCQQFSGLSFGPINSKNDFTFIQGEKDEKVIHHISIRNRPFLVEIRRNKCRLYLVGSRDITDIDEPLKWGEGIETLISRLVPAMMFIRHVFGNRCWHNHKHYASFIIDDPPLKKRYGFINFIELLRIMDQYKFSTNVAFIPWNYRRTDSKVAQIFRERTDRFSLSVHGCDHTKAEFGSRNQDYLIRQIQIASRRMNLHKEKTGISYDKVMIFPQGVFSKVAMRTLKIGGFLAAVNSSPYSINEGILQLSVRDFLENSIMKYEAFPLFIRRYPQEISEFALDLFLGKPLFIVVHHDFFRLGIDRAIHFIEQVNKLSSDIQWGSLGAILQNSYLEREEKSGIAYIKFYTPRLIIKNESSVKKRYMLLKRENGEIPVVKVKKDGQPISFSTKDGSLHIQIDLDAYSRAFLEVEYKNLLPDELIKAGIGYHTRVFFRRHISEFRDNYLSKNDFLLNATQRLRKIFFQRNFIQ